MPQASPKVLVQTNDPNKNEILVFERTSDGALVLTQTVGTNGSGGRIPGAAADPLASQGSLIYAVHHNLVFAVNAGSDEVVVLGFNGDQLQFRQKESSGGKVPVSLTVFADLLYVLNAEEGGSISGYQIASDGTIAAIAGSTLGLRLSTPVNFVTSPGQIGFTPDGQQLVVTTKNNTDQIIVFSMNADGTATETIRNNSNAAVPFGFTFDHNANLVVTEVVLSGLSTYSLNPATGVTQWIASQPSGAAACWVARFGAYCYVANVQDATLTVYSLSSQSVPMVHQVLRTEPGSTPIDLTITPDGQFLYVQLAGIAAIGTYRINANGTLTSVFPNTPGGKDMEGIVAI